MVADASHAAQKPPEAPRLPNWHWVSLSMFISDDASRQQAKAGGSGQWRDSGGTVEALLGAANKSEATGAVKRAGSRRRPGPAETPTLALGK